MVAASDALGEMKRLAAATASDSQTMLRLTRYVLVATIAAVIAATAQVLVAFCK
jgi:hypothetical protein